MSAISALLNPEEEERTALPSPVPSSRPTPAPSDPDSATGPPTKKQRLAKDAAIFTKHDVRSPIRYRPHERYGDRTLRELREWSVYPLGRIGEYRRRIPYSGGKSDFEKKTGRKAFEVYQYTFKVPATQQEFVVMWDYSTGLVRITPFFKCLQYAKTVPSRVIDSNSGLRDLCFSITGGALAAQGYWMPFEAARAVAATFCHSIRHVLVPLFGPDFVHECVEPADDKFANMKIDPKVTRRCAHDADKRLVEATGQPSCSASPATPRQQAATPEPRAAAPTSHPAPAGASRWRAVNRPEDSYLPSPPSTAAHEPAPLAPPPPPPPLTSAALLAHERAAGAGWWSDGEAGPAGSRHSASPAAAQAAPARVQDQRPAPRPGAPRPVALEQPSREEWAAAWALIRLAREDAARQLGG